MNIKLTMQQRLNLEAIVRAKRYTDIDDAVIVHSALKKLKVPKAERDAMIRTLPNGQVLADDAAILKCPDSEINLETAEVLKIRTRLEEWVKENGVTADDVVWFVPLVDALRK